jgi:hypothetical protein
VLFRRAKALSCKGDYEEADEAFGLALAADGSTAAEVERERALNASRRRQAAAKQKQQFANFFGRTG